MRDEFSASQQFLVRLALVFSREILNFHAPNVSLPRGPSTSGGFAERRGEGLLLVNQNTVVKVALSTRELCNPTASQGGDDNPAYLRPLFEEARGGHEI